MFDAVYVVDPDRRILFWSESAERLTGYTAESVQHAACGQSLLAHVDADGQPLCGRGCPLMASIADGKPREALVFLRHRCGHRVAVNVRTARLLDAKGCTVGGVEVFRPVQPVPRDKPVQERLSAEALHRRFAVMQTEARVFGVPITAMLVQLSPALLATLLARAEVRDKVCEVIRLTLIETVRPSGVVYQWAQDVFIVLDPVDHRAEPAAMPARVRRILADIFAQLRHPAPDTAVHVTHTQLRGNESLDNAVDSLLHAVVSGH